MRINRARRAELVRAAARIRQTGQRADWGVTGIAEEITRQLPELTPLEVWRLAYGWSRPQVVEGVTEVYRQAGLAEPGLDCARLCRWEHGQGQPSMDYAQALSRVYDVPPRRLGLSFSGMLQSSGYGLPTQPCEPGATTTMTDPALTAIADSIGLHLAEEGHGGGPAAREQVARAVDYYTTHYTRHAPNVLAGEIHRCRRMVIDMLANPQRDPDRRELRRNAGWLSALLGDFAFSSSDYAGAHIHLSTGARLGVAVGDRRLTSWSLGAQSMVAYFQNRADDAWDLACQAQDYADTPLHQAQITAWCELRALAALGRGSDARQAATRAQHRMDVADGDEPGRFGFDRPELHQHLAEAALQLGDTITARGHAEHAITLKTPGSGGWAAATVILARTHAAEHAVADATALAGSVLDAVPAEHLRETTRRRLAALDADLRQEPQPAQASLQFHDRLATLPAHIPAQRTSPEPNGH